jgi:glycosyltransferase involved in cell wall biosynthesis
LKIAFWHFHTFRLLRGIESLIVGLSNALVNRGVDVSIVTAAATTPSLTAPDSRIKIYAYPTSRYYSHQFIVPFYVNHFLFHGYDHVVAFFADFGEGSALRIINALRPMPLTLYLCYPYSGAPHRYHSFRRQSWESKARNIFADAIWIAEEAERFFGRPVPVVPVGTDPDRFVPNSDMRRRSRHQWGFTEGDVVLLNVSSLERRKGIHRVIQTMSRLRRRFPRLRYFILGEGEEKPELVKLVSELGLNEVVIFAGTTSELEAAYNMADVFVMLTDAEGNSVACHEAMSTGLPVVVSDTGGFIESVPARAGFRVSPDDPKEIDDALSRLIDDPLLRQTMGQAGRSHVQYDYSWDKTAEKFLKELQ